MVFVFMLAIKLYNTALGIVLGLLTLVPLINLIVLLVMNGKATKSFVSTASKSDYSGPTSTRSLTPLRFVHSECAEASTHLLLHIRGFVRLFLAPPRLGLPRF